MVTRITLERTTIRVTVRHESETMRLSLSAVLPAFVIFAAVAIITGAATPFECRWTEQPILPDGRADEPAWAGAATI
jgi:hypothetical protein